MAKITRALQKIFGINALADQLGVIGSKAAGSGATTTNPETMQSLSNFEGGLYDIIIGDNSPCIEDFNSLHFLATRQLAYIFQAGIAEWDDATTYYIGSLVNVDGEVYKSIVNDNLNHAVTDVAYWINPLQNKMQLLQISNWSARPLPENFQMTSVVYGNGIFVGMVPDATLEVVTSRDGVNWTSRNGSIAAFEVAYGNGLFVAITDNNSTSNVMTSPDGITWTTRTGVNSGWTGITFGNNLFVAVAQNDTDRVMTSPDGITWTARTASQANQWYDVTYGNGLYVAVSQNGTNRVMTSPDGITWTNRSASVVEAWEGITYAYGLFVAVGSGGKIMTSPDGITWTTRTSPNLVYSGITYGNGIFVAVAQDGNLATSPDGITWTQRSYPDSGNVQKIAYGNGSFVIGADSFAVISLNIGS